VLPDLVAFQLEFLRELGAAVAARIDPWTFVGFSHVAGHIADRDEHLAALFKRALHGFLDRRIRPLMGAPQMPLQVRYYGVRFVAALVRTGVLFLRRSGVIIG